MGKVADTHSDIVFVTNDNPRTEDPYKILDDVVADSGTGCTTSTTSSKRRCSVPQGHVPDPPQRRHETMKLQNMCQRYVIVDRWYAIRGAIAMAEDDVVLICGRDTRITPSSGTTHWFDDGVEATDALQRIVTVQRLAWTTNIPWARADRNSANAGSGNVLAREARGRGRAAARVERSGGDGARPIVRACNPIIFRAHQRPSRARVVVSRIFSHASSPSSMVAWASAAARAPVRE